MATTQEIMEILRVIARKLDEQNPIQKEWLTKKEMKKIFSYSDSALRRVEQKFVVSKIGVRKFYSTKSVLKFLEVNKINNQTK